MLLAVFSLQAQKTEITGTVLGGTTSDTVYLLRYRAGKLFVSGKAVATKPIKFSVGITTETSGLYFISPNKQEKDGAELILVPGQKLQFTAEYPSIQNSFKLTGSDSENDAYINFMQAYGRLDSMLFFTSRIRPDEYDSLYINSVQLKQARIHIGFTYFATYGGKSLATNSYVNNNLIPFSAFEKPLVKSPATFNYSAWFNKHFFDHVNFNNPLLLNHYLINELLSTYFKYFVPKTEEGIINGIDYVYAKLPATGPVREYLLDRMLNVFAKDKNGNVFKHLYSKLGNDDHCALNIDQAKADKLMAGANLGIGDKLPDFELYTIAKLPFSLLNTIKDVPATVFVWKANCIHCLDTWKKMKDENYLGKSTGAFIAICIDSNLEDIPEPPFAGPAFYYVYDNKKAEESILVKKLGIATTPAFFTIDKEGKITGRYSTLPGL